ncbi:MAG: hypothetical protein ACD_28C00161G0009 [uncultured bacterium]|nr:MAG: hypothetical protein ACD_28C00161G0009 [uncultured bacterium]KKT77003.1 MAG: hypothetical protein UW70_C0006G0009 [Candidatus Peregrinibacteria bacterium GW2011_GWA2_44_7]
MTFALGSDPWVSLRTTKFPVFREFVEEGIDIFDFMGYK